jgi:DNA-directed RNA polymerase specialized sigma24 family protein
MPDPAINPERFWQIPLLGKCLSKLDESEQQILRLWACGYSAEEIAKTLGITGTKDDAVNIVNVRIHRAKQRLRKCAEGGKAIE